MTSSPPITTSGNQGPPARAPWWRQWLEPAVAAAIITALVIALVSIGVAGFQSLKGDMRDLKGDMRDMEVRLSENIIAVETRLTQKIEEVRMDAIATETRLSEALAASEARQQEGLKDFKQDLRDFKQDLKDFKAEVRADNRALNDKLDRVLESLPAAKG